MVAISSQCSFGAGKAVQLSQAVFFDEGTQLRHKNCKITLINRDIISSLWMALLEPNFRNITTLLYFLCTRNRFFLSWSFDLQNSPGADFCTCLSFWLGTTYLPEKVWLQKCSPGVFCNTPRYVVQLNCGSSFAVGRHLWTYPTLNQAKANWEENTPHVQPLLPFQHISL